MFTRNASSSDPEDKSVADVFSRAERSRIMAAIGPRNTTPEKLVAAALRAASIRFRRHVRDLPGCPDFVLCHRPVAVFVHGCFWHGHSLCRKGTKLPSSNVSFWRRKIDRNRRRDLRAASRLRRAGFSVLTIWECDISADRALSRLLKRLTRRRRRAKSDQA